MGSLLEQCVTRVGTRRNHAFDDEAATRKMHHELARARSTAATCWSIPRIILMPWPTSSTVTSAPDR
jgi:hypothetical protein